MILKTSGLVRQNTELIQGAVFRDRVHEGGPGQGEGGQVTPLPAGQLTGQSSSNLKLNISLFSFSFLLFWFGMIQIPIRKGPKNIL